MDLIGALNDVPLAGLMLVIAVGWALGRREVAGLSISPAGGTLFVALALGWAGLEAGTPQGSGLTPGRLGFALFIYSVGFDAAPHFLSTIRESRGVRFLAVAVAVNVSAAAATVALAHLMSIDASTAAGLLAGALTSAPTFAAAAEIAPDPARLSVAFALTYPFGLVGFVAVVQLLPRILREEMGRGAASEEEWAASESRRSHQGPSPELQRAFVVETDDIAGKTLRELALPRRTGCVIARIHHCEDDRISIPTADLVLELGDRLAVTGRVDELREFQRIVGSEIPVDALSAPRLATRRIVVRSRNVSGRTLAELDLIGRFHCVVTRVERGTLWLEPDADVCLASGDVIEAVGERDDVRKLARALGAFETPEHETNIAIYAGGILLGVILGSLELRVAGVVLSLGFAGGLLIAGLLLGARDQVGPLHTHVPREARQLVRDLGILLFVGQIGLAAGATLAGGLDATPWTTLIAGVGVTLVAITAGLGLGRIVLRLRPVDAWGSVAGGLTSSAALHAVRRAADSNEPAIAYAAAYAVGSVLATMAGPIVVLLVA